jgi:hypothetical protein
MGDYTGDPYTIPYPASRVSLNTCHALGMRAPLFVDPHVIETKRSHAINYCLLF